MKRTITYLLTAIMLLSLIAGCSNKKTTEVETPTAAPNAQATATVEPAVTTEPTATPEPSLDDLVALSVANRPAEPCDQATRTEAHNYDTMEFHYFDIDYDGYEDWMEDWTLEGKQNYQYGEFYWYDDADGDGLLNVFDEDWAGYKFLPFGADELPKSMADVPERTWETADYSAQLEVLANAMTACRAENGWTDVVTPAESNYICTLCARYTFANHLADPTKKMEFDTVGGAISCNISYEDEGFTYQMLKFYLPEADFLAECESGAFDWDSFQKMQLAKSPFSRYLEFDNSPDTLSVTAFPYTHDSIRYIVVVILCNCRYDSEKGNEGYDENYHWTDLYPREPHYCAYCGKMGNNYFFTEDWSKPYSVSEFWLEDGNTVYCCKECAYAHLPEWAELYGINEGDLEWTWGK